MLNDTLIWWRAQIQALVDSLLPPGWRPGPPRVRTMHVDAAGSIVDVDGAIAGVATHPGAGAAADRAPLLLSLPPGSLMAREVAMPLAVGRDLAGAVGFEMDRLTPFSAAELLWTVRPVRRDTERGQMLARLVIVPRGRVEPLLASLAGLGLHPHALSDGGDTIELPLGRHMRALRRRRLGWLAGLCAVLAITAVAAPFLRLARQEHVVAARMAALQPRADAALRLRRQLAQRSTAAAALAEARRATGDALSAIAAVTRALPDDSSLSSLGLHQLHLSLDGQSAAAARLIGRIAADPALREPSFAAPVTSTGTHDLFSIHATLATATTGAGIATPQAMP